MSVICTERLSKFNINVRAISHNSLHAVDIVSSKFFKRSFDVLRTVQYAIEFQVPDVVIG